jgi:hypothetical protein
MGNFSFSQNWFIIILIKDLKFTNVFTTGTLGPTASVWPEQGSLILTS